jgi:hypothetical protein
LKEIATRTDLDGGVPFLRAALRRSRPCSGTAATSAQRAPRRTHPADSISGRSTAFEMAHSPDIHRVFLNGRDGR